MNKHMVTSLLTLAISTLSLTGCGQTEANQKGESGNPKTVATADSVSPQNISIAVVSGIEYIEKVELPGASVHGFETTRLMAKVGGYVEQIKSIRGEEIDVGTRVSKNDELAILEIPEMADELREKQAMVSQAESEVIQANATITQAKAEITRRKAEVEQAKAQRSEKKALWNLRQAAYKRISRLVKEGAIGEENLDEAKFGLDAAESALVSVAAEVKTAEARILEADANLVKANADKQSANAHVKVAEAIVGRLETLMNYATIKAPFDGVITKRLVDHGAFVRPATSNSGAMPLFEVTRIDKVRIVVPVPNTAASKVAIGQKVIFERIGGLPGVAVEGAVTRSAIALDSETRMMRIDVHLSNPVTDMRTGRKITLKPGLFGTVTVAIKSWKGDKLLPVVPTAAVAEENGRPYVMVIATDGRCQKRMIEVAFNDAIQVGISNGVKFGEKVATSSVGKLKDGQTISTKSP